MTRPDLLKPSPANQSGWPDLRHKYRRIGIPAVAAAIVAGRGERAGEERRLPEGRSGQRKRQRST
jgi:hypothetical protein